MANRVLLDQNGLRISKPGQNVLTASADDLMFDSVSKMVQVVASGIATGVSNNSTRTISWPSLGFVPFVWIYGSNGGNIQLRSYGATSAVLWGDRDPETVYWAVLNIPRG